MSLQLVRSAAARARYFLRTTRQTSGGLVADCSRHHLHAQTPAARVHVAITASASYSTKCVCNTCTADHEEPGVCWKCGSTVDTVRAQYFCECGVVQRPDNSRSLFEVMEVAPHFNVDTAELKRSLHRLQTQLHPDKFSTKSDVEMGFSEMHSSLVNKAYSTLVKPLSRGLYMLEQNGFSLEEHEIQMDPEFLMEIMEVNEALAETEDMDEVRRIGASNAEVLKTLIDEAAGSFEASNFKGAKQTLAKIKYYANIDEKVKDREDKSG